MQSNGKGPCFFVVAFFVFVFLVFATIFAIKKNVLKQPKKMPFAAESNVVLLYVNFVECFNAQLLLLLTAILI